MFVPCVAMNKRFLFRCTKIKTLEQCRVVTMSVRTKSIDKNVSDNGASKPVISYVGGANTVVYAPRGERGEVTATVETYVEEETLNRMMDVLHTLGQKGLAAGDEPDRNEMMVRGIQEIERMQQQIHRMRSIAMGVRGILQTQNQSFSDPGASAERQAAELEEQHPVSECFEILKVACTSLAESQRLDPSSGESGFVTAQGEDLGIPEDSIVSLRNSRIDSFVSFLDKQIGEQSVLAQSYLQEHPATTAQESMEILSGIMLGDPSIDQESELFNGSFMAEIKSHLEEITDFQGYNDSIQIQACSFELVRGNFETAHKDMMVFISEWKSIGLPEEAWFGGRNGWFRTESEEVCAQAKALGNEKITQAICFACRFMADVYHKCEQSTRLLHRPAGASEADRARDELRYKNLMFFCQFIARKEWEGDGTEMGLFEEIRVDAEKCHFQNFNDILKEFAVLASNTRLHGNKLHGIYADLMAITESSQVSQSKLAQILEKSVQDAVKNLEVDISHSFLESSAAVAQHSELERSIRSIEELLAEPEPDFGDVSPVRGGGR